VQLAHYLGLLHRSETELAEAYRQVATEHGHEPDVEHECRQLASQCDEHAKALQPFVDRYGEGQDDEPDQLHGQLFGGTRTGPLGLLRDLHDLYLMGTECDISWTMVGQAAQGVRDEALLDVVKQCEGQTTVQLRWIRTRMKQAAPQVLVVAQ
jgi:hypothetical protein